MAEFARVWGELSRLCKETENCSECLLKNRAKCDPLGSSAKDGIVIEEIVLKWSEEHSQKRLIDVFLKMFPKAPLTADGVPRCCIKSIDREWEKLAKCKTDALDRCKICWVQPAPEDY